MTTWFEFKSTVLLFSILLLTYSVTNKLYVYTQLRNTDFLKRSIYVIFVLSLTPLIVNADGYVTFTPVSIGTSPDSVAVNPATNRVYLTNTGDNTVSVIDTTTNKVIATISVGIDPEGIALNPAINRAYVANTGSNTVSVIDTITNSLFDIDSVTDGVQSINVSIFPDTVEVNPATNRAYVTNEDGGIVSVIDTTTNKVIGSILAGEIPIDSAVDPTTNRLYVADFDSHTVFVIDTTTNTVIDNIAVGRNPFTVEAIPATNRVYAVNQGSDTVSVIDTTTNKVIDTIDVDKMPFGIAVNTVTNRAYVTNIGSNNVSVIDTTTNKVIDTIDVGTRPSDVAINPLTNRIYVPHAGSNNVYIIDLNTGAHTFDAYLQFLGTQTFDAGNTFGKGTQFGAGQKFVAVQDFGSHTVFGKKTDFTNVVQKFTTGMQFGEGTKFATGQQLPQGTVPAFGLMLESFTCPDVTCTPPSSLFLAPGKLLPPGTDPAAILHYVSPTDKSFSIPGLGFDIVFDSVTTAGEVSVDLIDPETLPSSTAGPITGTRIVTVKDSNFVNTGSFMDISLNAAANGTMQITMPYDKSVIPLGKSERQLELLHFTNSEWKTGSRCTVDGFNSKITCTVSSLSPFGVGVKFPGSIASPSSSIESTEQKIPDWIKNNAKWWSEGQIEDSDFTKGIQHMINKKIINIPQLPKYSGETEQKIPDWIKNNAKWWSEGQISEKDFVNGIKHMVEKGIIQVN